MTTSTYHSPSPLYVLVMATSPYHSASPLCTRHDHQHLSFSIPTVCTCHNHKPLSLTIPTVCTSHGHQPLSLTIPTVCVSLVTSTYRKQILVRAGINDLHEMTNNLHEIMSTCNIHAITVHSPLMILHLFRQTSTLTNTGANYHS